MNNYFMSSYLICNYGTIRTYIVRRILNYVVFSRNLLFECTAATLSQCMVVNHAIKLAIFTRDDLILVFSCTPFHFKPLWSQNRRPKIGNEDFKVLMRRLDDMRFVFIFLSSFLDSLTTPLIVSCQVRRKSIFSIISYSW